MARLGIDLGTTRSAAGVMEASDPKLLMNNHGDRLTPSIVYFDDSDGENDVVVGKPAKSSNDPKNEIREVKRHMGEDVAIEAGGDDHSPADVSAKILEKLISYSEEYLDEEVDELVITVPAYFTADQKGHTRQAARKLGFDDEDIELLHEPTAAAVAYGYNQDINETVLVFDFGGGTLDISIMEIDGNNFNMIATSGDTELGGADFTQAIVDLLADEYEADEGLDPRDDKETLYNLRQAAEERKKDLSANKETTVNEPLLGQVGDDIIGITERVLTRNEFESEVESLLDRSENALEEALEKAGLDTDDIDSVLLVGGSSKIPGVQDHVKDYMGFEPDTTNDLDRIVAQGAAIVAGGENIEEQYSCPQCDYTDQNIIDYFEHIVDEHGTGKCPFPGCSEEPGEKAALKSHLADEHGGDINTETIDEKDIVDIVTRSLGTDIRDGKMDVILEQGTKLEAENTRAYKPVHPDQGEMPIEVYQGDNREDKNANEQLHSWSIDLEELPEIDDDIDPIVEVTFALDEDGVLEVTAKEQHTGEEMTTTVKTSGEGYEGPEKAEADD
ncbi:Hsp70 family protein (plasmid) [Halorubrum sp. BOL3-1]|uniref:Hsp70 family protein n=1 Tax=Halorubrum sp. BOL3-1 TaxID=2497325 RepID=UPI001004F259|nr:Hsp70 family protein [Halorubrum sp. BOL3-1]QAU11397.1 Hsp70 family protein [Halorubrum sp. BOL3-1]